MAIKPAEQTIRVQDESALQFKKAPVQAAPQQAAPVVQAAPELEEEPDDEPEETPPAAQAQAQVAEPVEEVEEEPEEVEETPVEQGNDQSVFRLLELELDDAGDEFKLDGFHKDLDAKKIAKMDPFSKRLLHNARIEGNILKRDLKAKEAKLESDYQKKFESLSKRERALAVDREKLNAWVSSPKVQEALKVPEGDLPPITTPEGQEAHMRRIVAETIRKSFQPLQEEQAQVQRESDYRGFIDTHPNMQDQGFKDDMAKLMKARHGEGRPLTLEDAHDIVNAKKLQAGDANRRARQLKARQTSASQINKRGTAGEAVEPLKVPLDVRKKGPNAIANYLKTHEKVAQNYRR